ncbi:MAG TPA: tetratricopeptide repeat protein [Acidobacteria bacterium]|nr:tetratricopeptide repeat protein [Acidobacteriota bacterium]
MTPGNHDEHGNPIAPGSAIGRYIVLHPVGSGAMGVVVAAYDPELDRKLAIKVVRPDPLGVEPGEAEQRRLLREAQAMAVLAHPNVVTVFDVGTVNDRVFIAMEYLDSETASRWLEPGRTRAEILHVFQEAGKGLVAAHRAGLVHRDFKLDNVLVARDGRVKVTDFGLARPLPVEEDWIATGGRTVGTPVSRAPKGSGRLLDTSLTAADFIAGTPSYMAPECLQGKPATPASDQFSFCVALYRALYGDYPFVRRPALDLITKGRGPVQDPPAGSTVPPWIRSILLRGLAEHPEDRFPSMEDLLAALDRDPARKRRRLLRFTALAVGVVGVLGGAVFLARRPGVRCERAADAMAAVWNDSVRRKLADAFTATGAPAAGGSWQRVAMALDGYAARWKTMRVDACRATHVRGEQSEELLDLRMACLDDRLEELRSVIEHLSSPDEKMVLQAPRAVFDLSSIASCADTAALTAPIPPPQDPGVRSQVRELRRRLAEVRGARLVGNMEESIATVRRIVQGATELGYEPLLAEAFVLQGRMEEVRHHLEPARRHLEGGLAAALAGRDDRSAVNALIGLTWLDGNDTFDFPRAHTWARLAGAILQRLPKDEDLALELANALGSTYQAEGRLDEAVQEHQAAIELARKLHGPDSFFVARSMGNLATVELTRGNFQGAAELLRRVVPLIHRYLGDSFNTAMAENNLAAALLELGETGEARSHFENAGDIYARTVGATSAWTVIARLNLAVVTLEEGRYRRTLRELDALSGGFSANFPPDHPFSAYMDYARGSALLGLGRIRQALPLLERALRIRRSSGAVMPYELAQASFALARARWAAGQRPEARKLARKAAAILDGLPEGPMPFRDRVTAWLAGH